MHPLWTLLAAVAVAVQYAYVFSAATVLPPRSGLVRADCFASAKGGKVAPSARDCGGGQGAFCTRAQPCTPCASDGGCVSCANSTGACGFLDGVGPYCDFGGGTVGPCTLCCSE
jgi:hypothetical protein